MSRLTLEWHLRGIIEGTTEDECIRVDIEWSDALDEFRPVQRYYDAGSYTTGFAEDGRFCDAFDVPARKALNADDTVAFLDTVAHDPVRPLQERHDAAQLLDHHIWPDPPDAGPLGRGNGLAGHADRTDIDVSEWVDAGMTGKNIGPTYFAMKCVNDACTEAECLADPDVLRDEGRAECMVCGTEQPIPEYP